MGVSCKGYFVLINIVDWVLYVWVEKSVGYFVGVPDDVGGVVLSAVNSYDFVSQEDYSVE